MKIFRVTSAVLPAALAAGLFVSGCSKQAPPPQEQPNTTTQQQPQQYPQAAPTQQAPAPQAAPAPVPQQQAQQAPAPQIPPAPVPPQNAAPAPPPVPVNYTIPAGTHLRVTLNQDLGSKISQAGETFTATIADPVVVSGRTVVRAGSPASGTVIDAKSLGRFKGQASLAIRLDQIRAGSQSYEVETSTIEHVEKGKGKRTAVLAGGGGGLGALIGGLAGGGKGALIGGLAGAGAGTAGSAFTGNKEIVIPAETTLTFRLTRSVTVSR